MVTSRGDRPPVGAPAARAQTRTVNAVHVAPRRAVLVARLADAVDELASEVERAPLPPLTGAQWGPREILCHLVYWHEWYAEVARSINHGEAVVPKVGAFPEFNRDSVEELGSTPVQSLVARLRRAQRSLGTELLAMSPHARITIKAGASSRGPDVFADRIEAHFRGHLRDIRRMRRHLER